MHVIQTTVDTVTVFRQAALVERRGEVPRLAEGRETLQLCVEGLPLSLDDTSIRISLENGSNWAVRNMQLEIDRTDEAGEVRIEDRLDELRRTVVQVDAERSAIQAQVALLQQWLNASFPERATPSESEGEPDAFPFRAWQFFVATCNERLEDLQRCHRELDWMRFQTQREIETVAQLLEDSRSPSWADPSAQFCKNLVATLVPLEAEAQRPSAITLSYIVPGARWRPIYKLYTQSQGQQIRLAMGAQVAQKSGESWDNARLQLSAAQIERITQLPDLPSRRIGRAQPPQPPSYREKPPSSDELFKGFDKWFGDVSQTLQPAASSAAALLPKCEQKLQTVKALQVLARTEAAAERKPRAKPQPQRAKARVRNTAQFDDFVEAAAAEPAPLRQPLLEQPELPQPEPSPAPQAAPMPPPAVAMQAAPKRMAMRSRGLVGGIAKLEEDECEVEEEGGMVTRAGTWLGAFDDAPVAVSGGLALDEPAERLEVPVPAEVDVQDYFAYALQGVETLEVEYRGQLRAIRRIRLTERLRMNESDVLEAIAASRKAACATVLAEAHDTSYQCVYKAQGRANVPADGQPYVVDVMSAEAGSSMRYLTIPLTEAKVFGRLSVSNPFATALLGGEVQVFLDNAYVFSTSTRGVGVDGALVFPMGVEQRLKVARNTSFHQEEKGLIGGRSTANHTVAIELRSQMPEAVQVDVLERLPVPDEEEEDVKVKVLEEQPPSHDIEFFDDQRIRGGRLWSIDLPPGDSADILLKYDILLPSKMEIVGGNRRA